MGNYSLDIRSLEIYGLEIKNRTDRVNSQVPIFSSRGRNVDEADLAKNRRYDDEKRCTSVALYLKSKGCLVAIPQIL